MRLRLSCQAALLLSVLFSPHSLPAQRVVLDPDAKPQGATSRTTLVRSGSSLYSLSIKQDGALLLLVSVDQGKTWQDSGFVFNDSSSGIGSGVLTNYCCLAVDSRGWLHASWRRATYPSFYSQYYRNVNPANTTQGSSIIDVQANIAKVSATTRSGALGLAIDSKGYVWMLATHSSWMAQLLRSDQPFAPGATPGFTSVGSLSGSGSASQNPALEIDSNDTVHCIFHYASGTRSVAHNSYDPATQQWSGVVRLGTPANNNGLIATDRFGNVHALYGEGSGSPFTLQYRRYDKVSGWSSPIVVSSFTSAQIGTSSSQWIFTIAAHPITGDSYAIYRDFANGGALVLAQKSLTDAAFSHVATLEPASTAQNVYHLPNVRGSLNPFPLNAAICDLDVVYWNRSGTKTELVFVGVNACSTKTFGSGCQGTNGTPTLSYGELPRLGRPFSVDLASARVNGACAAFLGASSSTWGAIPLPLSLAGLGAPGCSLQVSIDTITALPIDGNGEASLGFTMPNMPGLVGVKLYNQFLVLDMGANPGNLVTTQGGEFTIQP